MHHTQAQTPRQIAPGFRRQFRRLPPPWSAYKRTDCAARGQIGMPIWAKRSLLVICAIWLVAFALGSKSDAMLGMRAGLWGLVLLGFGLAMLGIRRDVLGLAGVVLLCTADAAARVFLAGTGYRWNMLNYFFLLVALANLGFVIRLSDLTSLLLKVFMGILAVWLVWSPAPVLGMVHAANIASYFGMIWFCQRGRLAESDWLGITIVAGGASALGGLYYFMHAPDLVYINHNVLGYFFLGPIFWALISATQCRSQRQRLILALIVAVNFGWVFLSGSRGSALNAMVVIGTMLFIWRSLRGWLPITGAAALGAALLGTYFPGFYGNAIHRWDKMLSSQYSLTARTSARYDIAMAGLNLFREKPLGVGTGGFYVAIGRETEEWIVQKKGSVAAHCGWVKVLAENGILGFPVFALFVASWAIVGLRSRDRNQMALGLAVSTVISIALLTTEFQPKALWLLGAAAATQLGTREGRSRRPWMDGGVQEGRDARRALTGVGMLR